MASTITVQQVVNYAQTQIRNAPLAGVGGFTNEPALTIANNVLQDIFAFPNAWRFNRKSAAPFNTVAYQQEYTLTGVSDIGWLERVVFQDTNSTNVPQPNREGECVFSIAMESIVDNPTKIALDRETQTGDSVVRLWAVPGTYVWTVYLDYQVKPPLITSLSGTWSPVPDELAFVYRAGFLYHAFTHLGDPRAEAQFQKFQLALAKARSVKDAEQQNEAFFPSRPIMVG